MKLTAENYHSLEANREYMSVSQFKDFQECEAMAIAKIRGEYVEPPTEAMLVSSFIDAYFSDEIDEFMKAHPKIFNSRTGELKAKYQQAYKVIARIEQEELIMQHFTGEKQVIRTGFIAGVPFKIKIDFLQQGKLIIDEKAVCNFKPIFVPGKGRLSFIEAWGYDLQGGVYQEIERQHEGVKLPFVIDAVTKEASPDVQSIGIPQQLMDYELANVKRLAPYYQALKNDAFEPRRCGKCDYCKATRRLNGIITLEDFYAEYIEEGDAE